MKDILTIALNFDIDSMIESIRSHGSGNVNDTYLVTLANGKGHMILQQVNTYVFSDPEAVMRNMHRATKHLQQCVRKNGLVWKVQQVILAKNGNLFWRTGDGGFWRMISFIEDSESFDTIYSHEQAYELGYALGLFHDHINRLDSDQFDTVLDGFHISPGYLEAFDRSIRETTVALDEELSFALDTIETYRGMITVLEDAKADGVLPLRIIHGDPKANNIMFDQTTHKAISVIDLDTIQPGLVHYDIGDCIRSSCNPLGEEPGINWRETIFDLTSFEHLFTGYLERGRTFLTEREYDYIYPAIFVLTFELGLRFLTDYLQGNIYYKIHFPTQNKYRALTQFKLAESIHGYEASINKIVKKLQLS